MGGMGVHSTCDAIKIMHNHSVTHAPRICSSVHSFSQCLFVYAHNLDLFRIRIYVTQSKNKRACIYARLAVFLFEFNYFTISYSTSSFVLAILCSAYASLIVTGTLLCMVVGVMTSV